MARYSMQKLLLIFLGSGMGGLLRYAVAGVAQRGTQGAFPLGTLVVNVTGCLAMGFLAATLTQRGLLREEYRIGLLVGVLGGYTTFSTFGWETISLLNDGQLARAALNVLLSVATCLVAAWIGYRLSGYLFGM
jgi:CrcB protein